MSKLWPENFVPSVEQWEAMRESVTDMQLVWFKSLVASWAARIRNEEARRRKVKP